MHQNGDIVYCRKCGTQLPDDAIFCTKCGASTKVESAQPAQPQAQTQSAQGSVVAPSGVTSLKCPSCGAPLSPKFGEMIISCEYCGTGVTLGLDGWRGIQKTSMLPLKFADKDQMTKLVGDWMNKGIFNHKRQEKSTLEEFTLSFVPYWIVTASAKTSITRSDPVMGAPPMIIFGPMGGPGPYGGPWGGPGPHGPGRRSIDFVTPMLTGAIMSRMMRGPPGAARKATEMNGNYYFPVIAVKSWSQYQPRNYQFSLDSREHFDVAKIPKGISVLSGDVGDEAAKSQAKTLVSQLQADKARTEYGDVEELKTDVEVAELELMYVPIWFVRYDHKGSKIILVINASSGQLINSVGL